MLEILHLPGWPLLLPFLAAALALNVTPGADMTYVIARAAGQGEKAGVVSAFGIATGSLVHSILAALGISALLAASPLAFQAVKYAGAAYLLYLAVRMALSARERNSARAKPPARLRRIYLEATLVNLLNPKVALFIVAFLPQFVTPERGSVAVQIVALGLLFNLTGTAINAAVAIAAARVAGRVKAAPRFKATMQWLSAGILGALALRLALSENR
ncbi:MAG: LysE family translocator [Rhodovibrionaceae bacterium]